MYLFQNDEDGDYNSIKENSNYNNNSKNEYQVSI